MTYLVWTRVWGDAWQSQKQLCRSLEGLPDDLLLSKRSLAKCRIVRICDKLLDLGTELEEAKELPGTSWQLWSYVELPSLQVKGPGRQRLLHRKDTADSSQNRNQRKKTRRGNWSIRGAEATSKAAEWGEVRGKLMHHMDMAWFCLKKWGKRCERRCRHRLCLNRGTAS